MGPRICRRLVRDHPKKRSEPPIRTDTAILIDDSCDAVTAPIYAELHRLVSLLEPADAQRLSPVLVHQVDSYSVVYGIFPPRCPEGR